MNASILYGRRILITGATSGIGKACAIKFVKAGYKVSGFAIDAAQGTKRLSGGGRFDFCPMDVTDDLSVEAALQGLMRRISL